MIKTSLLDLEKTMKRDSAPGDHGAHYKNIL